MQENPSKMKRERGKENGLKILFVPLDLAGSKLLYSMIRHSFVMQNRKSD